MRSQFIFLVSLVLSSRPCSTFFTMGESDSSLISAMTNLLMARMFTHERKKSEHNAEGNLRTTLYDLLSISLRFELDRVTKEVVTHIDDGADDTDPAMKICLGLAHDSLRHWIPPAYNALIERSYFLTRDEIIRLGAGRTAIVGEMRESYKRGEFQTYAWDRDLPSKLELEVPPDFYSA